MTLCPDSLQADVSTDLRAIWAAIGVAEDAQQVHFQDLSGQLAALLRGAVQREEGRQVQLQEDVERMAQELGDLCATLAEPQPDLAADPPGLLVQQHAAAAAALERRKVQRANRAAQRREMEAQCVSLHCELTDLPADKRSQVTASEIVPGPGPAEKDGLSESFLSTLRAELERLRAERAARIDQAAFFSSDIGRLQKELGLDPEQPVEPRRTTLVLGAQDAVGANGSGHRVSPAALANLEAELGELQQERERRLNLLHESDAYISELRTKLELCEAEWSSLPKPSAGLSMEVVAAYKAEIDRLEALKAAALPALLQSARDMLRPLWQELHMSEEETRACAAAWEEGEVGGAVAPLDQTAGEMAGEMERLLLACEQEAALLKDKLDSMSKVLGLMTKRASILTQRDEMLAAQNDPSRLLARKPAGWLLKEEKLRTSVEKHLPQITAKVRELAAEWQAEHGGETLRYEGQPLLELLEAQEQAEVQQRQEEKERKAAEKAADKARKEEQRCSSLPGQHRPSTAPAKRPAAAAAPPKRPNPSAVVAPRVVVAEPTTPLPPAVAAPPAAAAPPPTVEVEHAVPSERVLQILDMQLGSPKASPAKLESPAKKARLSIEQDKENPEAAATAGSEM